MVPLLHCHRYYGYTRPTALPWFVILIVTSQWGAMWQCTFLHCSVLTFLHYVVLLNTEFSPFLHGVVLVSADLLSAEHKGGSVTAVSQGRL